MYINGYGTPPPMNYGANSAFPPNSFGQIFANASFLSPKVQTAAYPFNFCVTANSWGPPPLMHDPCMPVSDFANVTEHDHGYNVSEPVGDLYQWEQATDEPVSDKPRRRREKRDDPAPERHVYDTVKGRVWGDPHFDGADAEKYDIQGKAGTIYNILSDDKVQVNAKFASYNKSATANVMGELGFRIGGDEIKVGHTRDGKKLVEINGKAQDMSKDWSKDGVSWQKGKLTIDAKSTDGESWKFNVDFKHDNNTRYLNLGITGDDIGKNSTATTGLWGHSLNNENTGNRKGGGGVLLGPDGKPISKSAKEGDAEHNAAMKLYVENSLFSTSSRWSNY